MKSVLTVANWYYYQECIRGSTELLYTQYKSRCDVSMSYYVTKTNFNTHISSRCCKSTPTFWVFSIKQQLVNSFNMITSTSKYSWLFTSCDLYCVYESSVLPLMHSWYYVWPCQLLWARGGCYCVLLTTACTHRQADRLYHLPNLQKLHIYTISRGHANVDCLLLMSTSV